MIKLSRDNLIMDIVKHFPEFKEYKDFNLWDINEPEVYGALVWVFGDYVVDTINELGEKSELVQRMFNYLNEKYDAAISDEYVLDYFYSEVFECIATSHKAIKIAKKYLKWSALERLNETLKWYQPLSENS